MMRTIEKSYTQKKKKPIVIDIYDRGDILKKKKIFSEDYNM